MLTALGQPSDCHPVLLAQCVIERRGGYENILEVNGFTMRLAFLCIAAMSMVSLSGCGKGSSSAQSTAGSADVPATTHGAVPIPPVGNAVRGKKLFAENCAMCHGNHGQGVTLVGQDLQTSKFVFSRPAAKVVAFIKHGRSVTNPLNRRHIAMPPFGGNANLTNQDLYDIVAYLRKLQ